MIVRLSVVLGPLLASLVAGAEARREDQVMARRGRQQQMTEDEINIKMLGISVPGSPGQDYPILATVPDTSFSCTEKLTDRNYADKEAFCQVYHTCVPREDLDSVKFSRLCPNGTIFDQMGQTCRWWYLVDCDKSDQFFNVQDQDNSVEQTQDYDYSYDYDNAKGQGASSSSSNSFSSENNDLSNANTFLFAIPPGLLNENILNNVFKFPLPGNITTNIVSDIFSSSSSSSSSSQVTSERDELFQPIRPTARPGPQRNRNRNRNENRNRNRVQGNQGTRVRNNDDQLNTISNQARERNGNQRRSGNNNEQRLGQQQSLTNPRTNNGNVRRTTMKNGKIFFEN